MSLGQELKLRKPIKALEHEAALSIYYTASQMKKRADGFFHKFGLTDVQFNVLALLAYQSGASGGLTQAELGDMMLVNRANVTSLVDRVEKQGLVVRTAAVGDRRSNIIKMTADGKKLFAKVEPLYIRQVKKTMSAIDSAGQRKLISLLGSVRGGLLQ
jgi:DNA-binding MarR family transcriptional regulator